MEGSRPCVHGHCVFCESVCCDCVCRVLCSMEFICKVQITKTYTAALSSLLTKLSAAQTSLGRVRGRQLHAGVMSVAMLAMTPPTTTISESRTTWDTAVLADDTSPPYFLRQHRGPMLLDSYQPLRMLTRSPSEAVRDVHQLVREGGAPRQHSVHAQNSTSWPRQELE